MQEIYYIDRITGKKEVEKVYGEAALALVYGDGLFSKIFSIVLLPIISKFSFLSRFYGFLQKRKTSSRKVPKFIKKYGLDTSEFDKQAFTSFNDFFTRKLKKSVRSIHPDPKAAILPADGRYFVFPEIDLADGFFVKGKRFDLEEFLQDKKLAKLYEKGSMVMARLCPTDYHRFHFPFDCESDSTHLINGFLHSVNPVALRKNIQYLIENKRYITPLTSKIFGRVLFIEVGATFVGSVEQTYKADQPCRKGQEKGFFSFGGSCIILLFEPEKIKFDEDLIQASKNKTEVKGLMGQSLGCR